MAAASTTTTPKNNSLMMDAVPFQSSASSAVTASTSAEICVVDSSRSHAVGVSSNRCDGQSNCSEDCNGTNYHDSATVNGNNTENEGSVQGSNTADVATQADRLKAIELIESYFMGVQPSVVLNAKSASTENYNNGFSTMEILHDQLLQSNFRSEDERLLNQIIIQPSDAVTTQANNNNNITIWDHASLEQQQAAESSMNKIDSIYTTFGNIHDQTTTAAMYSNRPRLLSSLSRQSSITENFGNALDAGIMSSTAWKPEFQKDHQEIPYSPAQIFSDRYGGTTSTNSASMNIDAQCSELPAGTSTVPTATSTNDTLSASSDIHVAVKGATATADHTAGAETLLLAAQVLHEGTDRSNQEKKPSPTRRKKRATKADAIVDEQELSNDRKIRSINSKSQDAAASLERVIPKGHAIVDDRRIALLIPDADITNNDVLLGRGGRTNHHTGNATYRIYKERLQDEYLRATKDEKTNISNRLVQMIHQDHGRFLKAYEPIKDPSIKKSRLPKDNRNDVTGFVEFWYEVDLLTARKKASQALREINTPENRAAKRAKYGKK